MQDKSDFHEITKTQNNMDTRLTVSITEDWLNKYKAAWETRDPDKAAALFSEDAEYYWTPFEEPKQGRNEIAAAWRDATSRQQEIHFLFSVLSVQKSTAIVHWHTSFIRMTTGKHVELDGILKAEFDENFHCRVFREWWHSSE